MINSADRVPRQQVQVMGHRMSVAVAGEGPTVVLVHGNATYSYMWRNIIPFLARTHRCLAPDLMGMGRSDLILPSGAGSYSFADQSENLSMAIEMLEPEGPILLIGHELGATMTVQYARKNPHRVAGLVLMEGAFRVTNDTTLDADIAKMLVGLRSPEGENLVLLENQIVEEYLPRLTSRVLSPAEKEAYREPYLKPGESRRAMLSLIRQLPLQGYPGPIDDLMEETRLWCAQSAVPKLVIGGQPGFLVPTSVLGTAARWASTSVASVRGTHFLPEESPARLTALILDWMAEIGHGR